MSKVKKVKNNEDLRHELVAIFNEMVSGHFDIRETRVKVQAASTILKSAALQMRYQDLRGEKPEVEFLES